MIRRGKSQGCGEETKDLEYLIPDSGEKFETGIQEWGNPEIVERKS